jgi:hypothetical protein
MAFQAFKIVLFLYRAVYDSPNRSLSRTSPAGTPQTADRTRAEPTSWAESRELMLRALLFCTLDRPNPDKRTREKSTDPAWAGSAWILGEMFGHDRGVVSTRAGG